MSYLNELNTKIELLRIELISLANIYGTTSDIVVEKSKELDALIHMEMKIRIQNAHSF